jgi:hypothetical protein
MALALAVPPTAWSLDLTPVQRASAYEALAVLGRATPRQLVHLGNLQQSPLMRAITRGDVTVVFYFNSAFPQRIKRVLAIRPRFQTEPADYGL